MIVVTAATGHIGQSLVQELLVKKQKVRAVARDAKKLKFLADRGAETVSADLADPAAVAEAFRDATAVFALIPPSYGEEDFRGYQNKVSVVLADALKNAGVRHVVNLSSLGANRPDKTGPIKGLHDHEQRLNKLDGVHVLHLRPTYFMENFFFSLGLIKSQGINGSPLLPDAAFPMIATRDIAAVAARRLLARDFMGKSVQELLGPREVSMAEATRVIGAAIGKPALPYVQFPYADARAAMIGMGMSPDVADQFNEMYKAFNEGVVRPTQARGPQTTTPTTIEEFAKGFAVAYSQS
ncbi:MAG: NmrA family NAD(P)-binding protein [Elusimicrobia bacterium]|nr:NmrA family NAD(P)-binding protein [Elusimicrobiota bacterium]